MQISSYAASTARFAPVLATLNRPTTLRNDEVERVQQLRGRERRFRADSFLHDDDQSSPRPFMITSGWVARLRWLADGRRQIVSTIVPGDLLSGGPADRRPLSRLTAVALTDVHVVDVSSLLHHDPRGHSRLEAALAETQRNEDERILDQIVRLGRQRALERVAHWIMETEHRLRRAGLSLEGRFTMPLTQQTLGDMLGLSVVHINRVVQALRARKLITFARGDLQILDFAGLARLADYPGSVT